MHVWVLSQFSYLQLFATPWTVGHQDPLSMEFSRQEYWNELLFPNPRDLPNIGIKPVSPAALAHRQADFLPLSHLGSPISNYAILMKTIAQ